MDTMRPASELAAEIQGKHTDEQIEEREPKDRREYTFNFVYTDERGKVWKGPFTNQCLSPNQKLQVGVLKASILGRLPYESFDAYTRELAERIAHMTISLIKRPDWARELGDLMDENIIHRIYDEEVISHEATFHRRSKDSEKGANASQDGAGGSEDVARRAAQGSG